MNSQHCLKKKNLQTKRRSIISITSYSKSIYYLTSGMSLPSSEPKTKTMETIPQQCRGPLKKTIVLNLKNISIQYSLTLNLLYSTRKKQHGTILICHYEKSTDVKLRHNPTHTSRWLIAESQYNSLKIVSP